MAYIVIVGPAHPFRGGIAASSESLARTWQKMGHTVELLTFTTQYPSFLFPGTSQLVDGPPPPDLKITRKISSINPVTWFTAGVYLKKRKPDLVLLRYWLPFMALCLGTLARVIRQNKYSKIIALTDNAIPHEHRAGDQQLTQYFVNSCHGFVTMSDTVTRDLRKFDRTKPIACQLHPVYDTYGPIVDQEEAKQRLHLQSGTRYILFFGFIRHYKGLDLLLEAMKDSRITSLGVKLIIAGEYYEPKENYLTLLTSAELQGKIVEATEFIPHERVADYFSAVDLVVQPYRTATQSGVTQIAYHFEKPMVVTAVGGLVEMIPDQKVGYVVPVKPSAIADAIVDFYTRDRSAEMVTHIKEEKKKFTWEQLAEAILDVKEMARY